MSLSDTAVRTESNAVPQNGVSGLRHWRHDLTAGLIVALVSMPLSLGIAVASGAPAVAGLLTAIIAGFLFSSVGGSYVTISSPAAGMAPVLFHAIHTLGRGNLAVGYPLVLPLIVLTGLIQLGLSRLRIGAISNLMPGMVISGMLTSIGLIVLVKQLPLILGRQFESGNVLAMMAELPSQLPHADLRVTLLGLVTLFLIGLFSWLRRRYTPLQVLPAIFYALVIGTLLGVGLPVLASSIAATTQPGLAPLRDWLSQFDMALPLMPKQLMQLPRNPLDALVFPNFNGLIATPAIWGDAAAALVSLLVVNTIETVATIRAVDHMDPFERQSDPQRTVLGVGVSNIGSSLAGGLTVIPEVMRSTVGILAGARTQWANVWNATLLLLGWLTLQPVLSHIPLTVLAAILMVSSLNLCKPANWSRAWQAGIGDFCVFLLTIVLTLTYDLMWGLVGGTALYTALGFFYKRQACCCESVSH